MASRSLSPALLDLLRCPCPAHATLDLNGAGTELTCTQCLRVFEIRDGIPVMLLDESTGGSSD